MRLFAALALLMHLCWPFMGQLRAADPQSMQAICTVHGVMTVPIDDAPESDTAKPACALCSAAAVAITAEPYLAPFLQVSARAPLDAFEAWVLPPTYYSPSRPRGPPPVA